MNSNKKAAAAQQEGIFKAEIVPITVKGHKRNSLVTEDEHIQHGTSMESLAKLKPVFLKVNFYLLFSHCVICFHLLSLFNK